MLTFTVVLLIVVIFAVSYVFLVMPRVADGADMDLQSTDYAHRGLHGKGIPENSMAAFKAAIDHGYGIELDLRISSDGQIFVFHDESLLRVCGIEKNFSQLSSRDIRKLFLFGSNQKIPLLTDVLDVTDGQVPLLIDVKPQKNVASLCKRLCIILDGYGGAFAIQSSEPSILNFFKKYRPRYARGQVVKRAAGRKDSKDGGSVSARPFSGFARTHMLTNIISRPDFISADGSLINEPAFLIATRIFGKAGFVRGVCKNRQYALCRKKGLYAIFDGIKPK